MKRIAFVCQRYGLEVNGGAELHCRQLAEHMRDNYEVEIITTKAISYISWANEYEKDIEDINGIKVRRFPVEKTRNIDYFGKLTSRLMSDKGNTELEEKWIDEQGPYSPKLVEYIEKNQDEYAVIIFFTYLYYTTARGIMKAKDKAILIPTAHDEPTIYLNYYKKVFRSPKAIFYNTRDEKEFVERKFGVSSILNNDGLGGVGVEIPKDIYPAKAIEKIGHSNYMVFVGRIDESKGCGQLFEFFEKYKKENDNDLKMVLVGKSVMDIPKNEDIISLGFVSDEMKFNVIAGAKFLILPSEFESLSMVVLEALAIGVPVIVNGKCKVLKSHCITGNSGLYYRNYAEFEAEINYFLTHEDERKEIGKQGIRYVEEYYQWDKIVNRLTNMIELVSEQK